jgi:SAM-dependent methyltransferase
MDTSHDLYSSEYFETLVKGSRRSAGVIAPYMVELIRPSSVIDLGCGVGAWLAAFQDCGVPDVCGVDGDYVRSRLEIAEQDFLAWDLTKPLQLERRFDLSVSLEVAEHLPGSAAADFVALLTDAAPVVVFSAAIPFQSGKGHVNEQWPEYWARMFDARGYGSVDILRPRFWNHPDVEWWYAQNMLVYVAREEVDRYPRLREAVIGPGRFPLSLVHPRRHLEVVEWIDTHWKERRD